MQLRCVTVNQPAFITACVAATTEVDFKPDDVTARVTPSLSATAYKNSKENNYHSAKLQLSQNNIHNDQLSTSRATE